MNYSDKLKFESIIACNLYTIIDAVKLYRAVGLCDPNQCKGDKCELFVEFENGIRGCIYYFAKAMHTYMEDGHIFVSAPNGTVCTEYAIDGTPMFDGRKLFDRIKEPPMYKKDLVCLKCGHCYWTIKEGGFPRPICELDKKEYLDKDQCDDFVKDTRDWGR